MKEFEDLVLDLNPWKSLMYLLSVKGNMCLVVVKITGEETKSGEEGGDGSASVLDQHSKRRGTQEIRMRQS